jgi:hypothetical protein
MRLALVLSCVLAFGCAPALPSAMPLGEGPLAKAETAAREKAEQDADAKKKHDVATTASAKSAAAPAPSAPPAPTAKPAADKPEPPKPETAEKADSGKAPAGAKIVYAGEYVGSDVTQTKMMGHEDSQKDDKARTRVDVASNGELDVTFIDSSNGKDICTLHAKPNGKKATFAPGQKCWGNDAGEGGGTLTKGFAEFQDKTLIVETDFDLEIPGPDDASLSGTIHYRFEGTRK